MAAQLEPHPDDIDWLATIEGAPHLECRFSLPAGSSEGQARMHAWEIWSHARANGSTPDRPIARFGLQVSKVAAELREAA